MTAKTVYVLSTIDVSPAPRIDYNPASRRLTAYTVERHRRHHHHHEVEDPVSSRRNGVGRRPDIQRRDLGWVEPVESHMSATHLRTTSASVIDIAISSVPMNVSTHQVMPNHPIAKNELNTNRNTTAAMPVPVLVTLVAPANIAMLIAWPAAPNNINFLRPNFSIVQIAMKDAKKYSVPFTAASNRLRNPERPMLDSNSVGR